MALQNSISSIQRFLTSANQPLIDFVRYASKKARSSTQNVHNKVRPKHRGWKYQDGTTVTQGTMLATQNTLRWLPGLNVGFGRNNTLYAMVPGRVMVTCEKVNPNWKKERVERILGPKKGLTFYKKYFNVIPKPQHTRFKLIEQI